MSNLGRYLTFFGLFLAALGALIWLFPKSVGWVGKLPGDIRIGNSVFIPIATSIVISIILTVLLNLLVRLFGR